MHVSESYNAVVHTEFQHCKACINPPHIILADAITVVGDCCSVKMSLYFNDRYMSLMLRDVSVLYPVNGGMTLQVGILNGLSGRLFFGSIHPH